MRAIWSGAVAFGLVNIPIKMYSAIKDAGGIKLHMLDKKDMCPIGYAKVCKHNHKEVKWEDIIKAFEYKKGEYVPLSEEDFKKANVRKTGIIDIVNFVPQEGIDPIYFVKPYFLEPEKNAGRPYVLLREALKQSGKVALAKFVIKEREHLGAIKPEREMLVLDQLRYQSEIRSPEDLNIPESKRIEKAELKMALTLIDQLTGDFKPRDYKDTYAEELMRIIEAKAKNKSVKAKGKTPRPTRTDDIMEMLKKSLSQSAVAERKKSKAKRREKVAV